MSAQTVTCSHCGFPFRTGGRARDTPGATAPQAESRRCFCCAGCALLARVPRDEKGRFPVNTRLVSMLAIGFLYFNQLLFWLAAALLAARGDAAQAARFLRLGAVAAFVVWGACAFVQWRERAARASDCAALAGALGVLAWASVFANGCPSAWPPALANAALLAWGARGVWRGRKK